MQVPWFRGSCRLMWSVVGPSWRVQVILVLLSSSLPASLSRRRPMPRRCCSPDQWEADGKFIGTTMKLRDPQQKLSAKFSYDYTNRRWAIEYTDSHNSRNNQRIVFDHKANYKYAITYEECYNVSLNAQMDKYCVPANTTHHGYYEIPVSNSKLGYDVWAYDMMARPVRMFLKTSRATCLPLQESSCNLYKTYWTWDEGEPICNPYAHIEQAQNGECFRSHVKHTLDFSGARPSAFITNMDFRNTNTTITNEKIFDLPADCIKLDEWPETLTWTDFWNMFIVMRKKD